MARETHPLHRTGCSLGCALLAGILCGVLTPKARGQFPTPNYSDLVYRTYSTTPGARTTHLGIYLPTTGPGPFPTVIYIHGGGWYTGGWQTPASLIPLLLSRGVAVVGIDYRLTSQGNQYGSGIPVTWPAQIHDCKGAIRWVRANAATYNHDPAHLGAWGPSAGGHLVACVGTMNGAAGGPNITGYTRNGVTIDMEGAVGGNASYSSTVQAVVDYFGPTDLLNMNLDVTTPPGSGIDHDVPQSPESHLVVPGTLSTYGIALIRNNIDSANVPYPLLSATAISANPITFARAGLPPMFVAHGTNDSSVPSNQGKRMADALLAAQSVSLWRPVTGAGHGVLGTITDTAAADWMAGILNGTLLCPAITQQPTSTSGSGAKFAVSATGTAPLTYRWQRETTPGTGVFANIADGASGNGATLSGTTTVSLSINNAGALDRAAYRCMITNACGNLASASAALTTSCPGNFNGTGDANVQDIFDFLAAWFVADPRADFNSTGAINVQDIFDFLASWFAGC